MSAGASRGARAPAGEGMLAILLHTHMPYVEGFGTWPFGEEWLWEAIAGCYVPLLDLLERGAPLTLSLTPVLCDQLEAPGIVERFERFVLQVRAESHARDAAGLRAAGEERLAQEIERASRDYARALERLPRADGALLAALGRHVRWTSSATHAILPLLASDAGLALQVRCALASHRRRFGDWHGGFWLPECAYAPWLEHRLHQEGVRAGCVELSRFVEPGAWQHLRPILTASGLLLAPIDRATISLVWSAQGYPAGGVYRDYHHLTTHHHKPWSNSGRPYDRDAALARARADAADFVARTRQRLREAAERADGALPGGGLALCALDTELLGHWWYEGLDWLEAVVQECARQGLELVPLDDALARCEPWLLDGSGDAAPPPAVRAALEDWRGCSWGEGGDLSTWSGPPVVELAFGARRAELEVLQAGARASAVAVRELLALQSSDWAFMLTRELAGGYPRERFDGHRAALRAALAGAVQAPRNLAVDARPQMLASP